ncbi:hypothetical protein SHI21_20385 [Bacteriovorax sp. PP10]|uniref:Uncharacterized protein n=1 Tax=Bacteriovorax antarcticus TaxID=3088717 RepID=A0ABU5W1A5_9BACT|nr:hypothetical protein [Bacteriovorax sp. PP10]MEA9358607.1 hypothetical protein [Bacteriovorax sp. PP10]
MKENKSLWEKISAFAQFSMYCFVSITGVIISYQTIKESQLNRELSQHQSLTSFIPLMANTDPRISAASWEVYSLNETNEVRKSIVKKFIIDSIQSNIKSVKINKKRNIDSLVLGQVQDSFETLWGALRKLKVNQKVGNSIYLLPKDSEAWKDYWERRQSIHVSSPGNWREINRVLFNMNEGDQLFPTFQSAIDQNVGFSYNLFNQNKKIENIIERKIDGVSYYKIIGPQLENNPEELSILCKKLTYNSSFIGKDSVIPKFNGKIVLGTIAKYLIEYSIEYGKYERLMLDAEQIVYIDTCRVVDSV